PARYARFKGVSKLSEQGRAQEGRPDKADGPDECASPERPGWAAGCSRDPDVATSLHRVDPNSGVHLGKGEGNHAMEKEQSVRSLEGSGNESSHERTYFECFFSEWVAKAGDGR
ncbi:MAG: hypothetical protein ACK56Q_10935, partial [Pirellulaceae bacterium]